MFSSRLCFYSTLRTPGYKFGKMLPANRIDTFPIIHRNYRITPTYFRINSIARLSAALMFCQNYFAGILTSHSTSDFFFKRNIGTYGSRFDVFSCNFSAQIKSLWLLTNLTFLNEVTCKLIMTQLHI